MFLFYLFILASGGGPVPFVYPRKYAPAFASPTSQALHLIHLARRPWTRYRIKVIDKRLHLQSMRNNLRQNFQERQKMCLPSLSIMTLTALVLPLLHFCERDSGLFHCGVTTNFIFILIHYYPYLDLQGRFARWRTWRACDVGEAKEGLENELWRRWTNGRVGEWVVT